MRKFDKFYFKSFSFDKKKLQAKFYYTFDDLESFEEVIDFKNNEIQLIEKLDEKLINNYLFNLHLALGISYYKLFPTKKLVVKSGFIDMIQIKFWKKFYLNGLGEFFIKNDINPEGLLNFTNYLEKCTITHTQNNEIQNNSNVAEKNLLLIGGGKDSIVSYNIIKNLNFDTFVFGKVDKIKKNTSKLMGKTPLVVKRKISKNLLKLNLEGYYNGHVPITGIIAFVSLFFCYLYNYKNIILSNEKSSSEENIIWKNIKINHQYSKSFEFEKDFSLYLEHYINSEIKYFSLLRGMYEYKIAEIFSSQTEFFYDFSSCNNNFKIISNNSILTSNQKWCCSCEKCCFVFLILSNFFDIKVLTKIFGENLFSKEDLTNIFRELIGFGNNKPFECVGTYEESFLSFFNAMQKYRNENFFVLNELKNEVLEKAKTLDLKKLKNKLSKIYYEDIIPTNFKNLIKKEI